MELFKEQEMAMKSPRLQWLEKHDIKTKLRTDLGAQEEAPWECWAGDYDESLEKCLNDDTCYPCDSKHLAWGRTEEEAIEQFAKNRGLILWYNGGDHLAAEPNGGKEE